MSQPQVTRQTSTSSLPHRTSHSSSATASTPISSHAPNRAADESRSPPNPATNNTSATNSANSEPQSQQTTVGSSNPVATRAARPGAPRTSADVVRRIVSPGSVLFAHQPPPPITVQRLQEFTPRPNASMDRRHPSSFQQLEKLGEGTYATVSHFRESCSTLRAGDPSLIF